MKNIINKRSFVFLLFLALVFSGCSAFNSEQVTENTTPLHLNLQFPESNQSGVSKVIKALNADPNSVASLTLSVTDESGKVLTTTTISVTPKALVSISFDAPLGRALTINATLFNASGQRLFAGRSIPLNFERGRSQSLTILMDFIQSLLGSWLLVSDNGVPVGEGTAPGLITFISSGEYFMSSESTRFQDCFIGMEHGFYSGDIVTGVFRLTGNVVDTTGGCGLHDPAGGPGDFRMTINNDILTLSTPDDGELTKFSRVQSDTNPLIGMWVGADDVSTTVITFVSDTEYFLVDDHFEDSLNCGGVSETANSGMERGTYTHNATTGAFSVTNARNIVDTNGGCGLNEFSIDPFANATLAIKNDTFILTELTNNESFHFSRVNFADYFPVQLGKFWTYENTENPSDTFTDSFEAIFFGGKPVFKSVNDEDQDHTILENDGTSLNILALSQGGVFADIPDVSIGIVSDGSVFKIDPTSGSPDTMFRFWDNINPTVKGIYGIDPLLSDLIILVSFDNNQQPNSHNTALGIPPSLGAVTDIDWYQKGVGEIVYVDIDAATGNIVAHYDLIASGGTFKTATVPGVYHFEVSDTPGLTHIYTFNADGTGVADFADEPIDDTFNWSVDTQGRLVLSGGTLALGLPDRYTLVSGTSSAGSVTTEIDDDGNGVYESFPTATFIRQ